MASIVYHCGYITDGEYSRFHEILRNQTIEALIKNRAAPVKAAPDSEQDILTIDVGKKMNMQVVALFQLGIVLDRDHHTLTPRFVNIATNTGKPHTIYLNDGQRLPDCDAAFKEAQQAAINTKSHVRRKKRVLPSDEVKNKIKRK